MKRCALAAALLILLMAPRPLRTLHAAGARSSGRKGDSKLIKLNRIYLSVHGLDWIGVTEDDPRRKTDLWEQFPGRCALVHPLDFEFRLRIYQRIDNLRADEGLFILPAGNKANDQMIAYAKQKLGGRCVVCMYDYNRDQFMKTQGPGFAKGLEEDRKGAEKARAEGVTDGQFENEFAAWERSKAWALNLSQQLKAHGYSYDPPTVEFLCWGGDWTGCAATYPIQMARAFGLAKPMDRRWDLIIRDESSLYVKASLVVGSIPMPENLRLYLFKSDDGRYCAEYWEGIHGPMDRAHTVTVNFPPDSVKLLNWRGNPVDDKLYGQVNASAGCGGHTPHRATIIVANPNLSLDQFHQALVSGTVSEKPIASR